MSTMISTLATIFCVFICRAFACVAWFSGIRRRKNLCQLTCFGGTCASDVGQLSLNFQRNHTDPGTQTERIPQVAFGVADFWDAFRFEQTLPRAHAGGSDFWDAMRSKFRCSVDHGQSAGTHFGTSIPVRQSDGPDVWDAFPLPSFQPASGFWDAASVWDAR